MSYPNIIGETVLFQGHNGDKGEAYYARPGKPVRVGGVVLIHHMPGWDEWTIEQARKIAHHGFACISPHLYFREGPGSPDDVGARVRAAGGVSDNQVVGDVSGSIAFLKSQSNSNGKIGLIGFCSGDARPTPLAACSLTDLNAAVDCSGGGAIVDDPGRLTPSASRSSPSHSNSRYLNCPLLGIFGNEDESPTPTEVNRTEKILKEQNKTYEFYRYDGAGHAFFNYARGPAYRAEATADGWKKVFAFYNKHLAG